MIDSILLSQCQREERQSRNCKGSCRCCLRISIPLHFNSAIRVMEKTRTLVQAEYYVVFVLSHSASCPTQGPIMSARRWRCSATKMAFYGMILTFLSDQNHLLPCGASFVTSFPLCMCVCACVRACVCVCV